MSLKITITCITITILYKNTIYTDIHTLQKLVCNGRLSNMLL